MADYDRKSTDFREHYGFVHKLARKYHTRVLTARLPMDFDDVMGELSIAFVSASKGYKVDSGYAFTTYFGMCAQNHMNKVLGKMSNEQYGVPVPTAEEIDGKSVGGLGLIAYSEIMPDADDPMDVMFADDGALPEDRVDATRALGAILSDGTLLPETRAYIGILTNPSMSNDAVLARIHARREEVREEIADRWGVSIRDL